MEEILLLLLMPRALLIHNLSQLNINVYSTPQFVLMRRKAAFTSQMKIYRVCEGLKLKILVEKGKNTMQITG